MSKTTNSKESGLEQHITDYLVAENKYVLRKGVTDGFTDTKLRLFYDKPVSHYNSKSWHTAG